MTDRELLELAAKAAGIHLCFSPWGEPYDCTGLHPLNDIRAGKPWNPLTDDGDALRMAQTIGMNLMLANVVGMSVAAAGFEDGSGHARIEIIEQHDGDAMKATRTAIVRAAAAIGATK